MILNSITLRVSKLRFFSPFDDKEVKMYSCGPTVYDYAHIGNLRSYVFADIVKRVIIRNGFMVKHTINLTDFDICQMMETLVKIK